MARRDLTPAQSQVDQHEPTGWVDKTQTTLSYTAATRTLTLTVGGSGASFYSGAQRFALAAAAAPTVVHANTTGIHYIYYDGSTTLTASTTVWTINSSVVPVAAIYYNATLVSGVVLDERHGIQMDGATHSYLHDTRGTQVESGFAASNYTLSDAADASTTPDIATGIITDEDLETTVAALTAGASAYKVWYRSGAAGEWTWLAVDFPFTYGTYIHYNQFTGGVWTRTELTNARYVNMYCFALPAVTSGYGFAWVMGQAIHTTVANANAENVNSLAYGTFPFTEAAVLYKLTFLTATGNANLGKVQLMSLTRIVGTTVNIAQTGINDHSGLSGLAGTNVHPALSVSTDITNFAGILTSSEVDVQKALDRLDDYAAPKASPTFTGKVTTAATAVGSAGLNLPAGTAPTAPADGDVWTTTAGIYVRINGVTVGPLGSGGGAGETFHPFFLGGM